MGGSEGQADLEILPAIGWALFTGWEILLDGIYSFTLFGEMVAICLLPSVLFVDLKQSRWAVAEVHLLGV